MFHVLHDETLIRSFNYLNFHDFSQIIVNKNIHTQLANHIEIKRRKRIFYKKLIKVNIFQIKNILNTKISIYDCSYSKYLLNIIDTQTIDFILENEDNIITDIFKNHMCIEKNINKFSMHTIKDNAESIIKKKNQINLYF